MFFTLVTRPKKAQLVRTLIVAPCAGNEDPTEVYAVIWALLPRLVNLRHIQTTSLEPHIAKFM